MEKIMDVRSVNAERMTTWAEMMNEGNAAALVAVGIGQGLADGAVVLCTVVDEDVSDEELISILRWAADSLENGALLDAVGAKNKRAH